jgi:hypothetical protein
VIADCPASFSKNCGLDVDLAGGKVTATAPTKRLVRK